LEIVSVEKSKVAVVNTEGEILVLTRSQEEDTRPGGLDWPGGKLDPGETNPLSALIREVGEELPGSQLHNIRPLDVRRKIKAGTLFTSHLFAAIAQFSPEGIELSFEHSDHAWVPRDNFPDLDIPNKYKKAVALGAPIFEELVELCRADSQLSAQLVASS